MNNIESPEAYIPGRNYPPPPPDNGAVEQGPFFHDPYRRLVDKRKPEERDPEIKAWLLEQNDYAKRVLTNEVPEAVSLPAMEKRLEQMYNTSLYGNTLKVGDPENPVLMWEALHAEKGKKVLEMQVGYEGKKEVIFDPNNPDYPPNTYLASWYPSPDGRFVACNLCWGGQENDPRLLIKDTQTGQMLEEKLERLRFLSLQWLPDSSGFLYGRAAKVGETITYEHDSKTEQINIVSDEHAREDGLDRDTKWERTYLHKLNTDQAEDEQISGMDRPPTNAVDFAPSRSDKYMGIYEVEVYGIGPDLALFNPNESDPDKRKIKLIEGHPEHKYELHIIEDKLILGTTWGASKGRVLWAPLDNPPPLNEIDKWQTLIPEDQTKFLVPGRLNQSRMQVIGDRVLLRYSEGGDTEVVAFDIDTGEQKKSLRLEGKTIGNGSAGGYTTFNYSGMSKGDDGFFVTKGPLEPGTTYRFDSATDNFEVFRQPEMPEGINLEDYEIRTEMALAEDGATMIPMEVLKKKSTVMDKNTPVVVRAYGFAGVTLNTSFADFQAFSPFLENGGAYVLARVRGGPDLGPDWQEQGRGPNKLNTRDDLLAVVQHLVDTGRTSAEHVALYGESNGGWTASTAALKAGEKIKAFVATVPVISGLEIDQHNVGFTAKNDLGDPVNDPAARERLEKADLYFNTLKALESGQEIPLASALYLAGFLDDRVGNWDAARQAAAQQAMQKNNPNKVALFHTSMTMGHGATSLQEKIEHGALVNSFLCSQLEVLPKIA